MWSDGAWVLGYSQPDRLEAQAVLDGVPQAGGTTRSLRLSAAVGRAAGESGAVLVLSTDTQETTASATLHVRDGLAEAEMQAASADGVRVNAKFRCSFVAS